MQFSLNYTYIISLLNLPLLHPPQSSESTTLGSLLPGSFSPASTLQVVVCICRCYFLHVPLSPPLTVSTGSFSVSPFPPCRWVHQCHLSRFHIYVLIYSICFSLSDLLHSVWRSLGPSTSLQITRFHSFLRLSDVPLYTCVTSSLSILPWRTFRLFPCPGYCKEHCNELWGACL